MYASVLAMFWTVPGITGPKFAIKIQVIGLSKILVGVTETWDSKVKELYRELVNATGAVFQDIKIVQFLDRDSINKPMIPSTWQKEMVGTVYLLDVAPWWYLSNLEQALGPSIHTG